MSSKSGSHPPQILVISGPSGSGKSTIINRLTEKYPGRFGFSVSHTTRPPRGAEQNGKEYHFVTPEEFNALVDQKGFVEHAKYGSKQYGTSKRAIEVIAERGETAILDIEMEGVKQVKNAKMNGARFLFLRPPGLEELEKRLRGRGDTKEDAIQERLTQASKELEYQDQCKTNHKEDRFVVNDDLDRAYQEVEDWVNEGSEGVKEVLEPERQGKGVVQGTGETTDPI